MSYVVSTRCSVARFAVCLSVCHRLIETPCRSYSWHLCRRLFVGIHTAARSAAVIVTKRGLKLLLGRCRNKPVGRTQASAGLGKRADSTTRPSRGLWSELKISDPNLNAGNFDLIGLLNSSLNSLWVVTSSQRILYERPHRRADFFYRGM